MLASVSNGSAVSTPENAVTAAPHLYGADNCQVYPAGSAATSPTTCEYTKTRAPVPMASGAASTGDQPAGTELIAGAPSEVIWATRTSPVATPAGRGTTTAVAPAEDAVALLPARIPLPVPGGGALPTVMVPVAGRLEPAALVATRLTVYVPGLA